MRCPGRLVESQQRHYCRALAEIDFSVTIRYYHVLYLPLVYSGAVPEYGGEVLKQSSEYAERVLGCDWSVRKVRPCSVHHAISLAFPDPELHPSHRSSSFKVSVIICAY